MLDGLVAAAVNLVAEPFGSSGQLALNVLGSAGDDATDVVLSLLDVLLGLSLDLISRGVFKALPDIGLTLEPGLNEVLVVTVSDSGSLDLLYDPLDGVLDLVLEVVVISTIVIPAAHAIIGAALGTIAPVAIIELSLSPDSARSGGDSSEEEAILKRLGLVVQVCQELINVGVDVAEGCAINEGVVCDPGDHLGGRVQLVELLLGLESLGSLGEVLKGLLDGLGESVESVNPLLLKSLLLIFLGLDPLADLVLTHDGPFELGQEGKVSLELSVPLSEDGGGHGLKVAGIIILPVVS